MRTPTENPVDPLGGLGSPVRAPAAAPVAPAPAPHFELGDWAKTLPEGLAEKPADPEPVSLLASASYTAWVHLAGQEPGSCAACRSPLISLCAVALCGNLDCRG